MHQRDFRAALWPPCICGARSGDEVRPACVGIHEDLVSTMTRTVFSSLLEAGIRCFSMVPEVNGNHYPDHNDSGLPFSFPAARLEATGQVTGAAPTCAVHRYARNLRQAYLSSEPGRVDKGGGGIDECRRNGPAGDRRVAIRVSIASSSSCLRAGVMGANDGIVSTAAWSSLWPRGGEHRRLARRGGRRRRRRRDIHGGRRVICRFPASAIRSGPSSRRSRAQLAPTRLRAQAAHRVDRGPGRRSGPGPSGRRATERRGRPCAHEPGTSSARPGELVSPWHAAWASMVAFRRRCGDPAGGDPARTRAIAVPVTAAATSPR